MAILRADMTRKIGCAGNLMRPYLVVGIFACLAAISALAQTEAVTVTLLPSYTNTTDTDPKAKEYLSVAASNIKNVKESQSVGCIGQRVLERNSFRLRTQPFPSVAETSLLVSCRIRSHPGDSAN